MSVQRTRLRQLADSLLLGSALLVAAVQAAETGPRGDSVLFWTHEQQISGYRAIDVLFPTRAIAAPPLAYPLPPAPRDFSDFSYRWSGSDRTLDGFMREQNVAGLIVLKDGKVLLERYGLGNDANSRWISFSIAKSVVSLLYGVALAEGYIESLDEKVTDYLPRLQGSPYDDVTLRQLLQMSSGIRWNEDYADPESDIARYPSADLPMTAYLAALPRVADPGTRFNYNTAETNVAGLLLRTAIGNNLATYTQEKLWAPFGMEADASWLLVSEGGGEYGGCCINATLRDYARIGLYALRGGRLADGTETLPAGFMAEATAPSPAYAGYGYFWWLYEGEFAALGVFGQRISVFPEENLVIALHSAWPAAVGESLEGHQDAFVQALRRAVR